MSRTDIRVGPSLFLLKEQGQARMPAPPKTSLRNSAASASLRYIFFILFVNRLP